jgi:hypothetical protein
VFPSTLIARIGPHCLFVFLRSCLCYGLLSCRSLAGSTLPFATVFVTLSGHFLSYDKFMPMLGTLVTGLWPVLGSPRCRRDGGYYSRSGAPLPNPLIVSLNRLSLIVDKGKRIGESIRGGE